MLVRIKDFCLGVEEVGYCVPGSVVSECDEETTATLAKDGARPPHICVNFLAKVLCLRANVCFGNRLAGRSSKSAAVTRRFARVGVKLDPLDQAVVDKGACTRGCNVAHLSMQLHHRDWFYSVNRFPCVGDAIEAALGLWNACNSLVLGCE